MRQLRLAASPDRAALLDRALRGLAERCAQAGRPLPEGPIGVRFEQVSFAYPGGPEVLHAVDLELVARTRVAVVGETGSRTLCGGPRSQNDYLEIAARFHTVLLSGVPLDEVRFDSLRSRVVMVPQDGFLFDATVADNVRFGAPGLSDDDLVDAFSALGLGDWLEQLPQGLATEVGERGDSLSVGERQLVAIARAYVADPDLLVLDEATSAVDPATEVRLQRALDSLTRGRTTLAIAHRLSTAEAADEILVVDAGVVVQRGSHRELVAQDGVYARLHRSWVSQSRCPGQPPRTQDPPQHRRPQHAGTHLTTAMLRWITRGRGRNAGGRGRR